MALSLEKGRTSRLFDLKRSVLGARVDEAARLLSDATVPMLFKMEERSDSVSCGEVEIRAISAEVMDNSDNPAFR